jgi:hypothetical protein
MHMVSFPFALNITDTLPTAGAVVGSENSWVLYVFAALILGIILGGTMRGLAKLVLAGVLLCGFAVLVLISLQRHDLLSTIASIVFGVIILLFSFLVKIGKSYPYVKR